MFLLPCMLRYWFYSGAGDPDLQAGEEQASQPCLPPSHHQPTPQTKKKKMEVRAWDQGARTQEPGTRTKDQGPKRKELKKRPRWGSKEVLHSSFAAVACCSSHLLACRRDLTKHRWMLQTRLCVMPWGILLMVASQWNSRAFGSWWGRGMARGPLWLPFHWLLAPSRTSPLTNFK